MLKKRSFGFCNWLMFLPFSVYLYAQTEIKIIPADCTAGDEFGYEISTYEDYSVIGALRNDEKGYNCGAAYICEKTGNTIALKAKLTASDGTDGAVFGKSVSIFGTDVVVGSPWKSLYGEYSGGTYVFRKNGNAWDEVANLYPSDGLQSNDHFGWWVSIYGDYLVTSSMKDCDMGADAGAVYFFVNTGSDWIQIGKYYASDGTGGDQFGRCVSLYGDFCAIGAPYNLGNETHSGAVYIFKKYGVTWHQIQKIIPGDGDSGDDFGLCLSLYDDVLVVSSNKDDDKGEDAGAVYIYDRIGDDFIFNKKVTCSQGAAGDFFGYRPTVFENRFIVGAPQNNTDMFGGKGYAVIYKKIGNEWVEEMILNASDGQEADSFGWSTSLNQECAMVGAKLDDDNGDNSGSTYMFSFGSVPVELTSFSGSVMGSCVELNWSTATELNNSGFEVQRKFGEEQFKDISFIKGQGSTTEKNEYLFSDCNLPDGLYMYRLKQIDNDGTYTFSREISIEIKGGFIYKLNENFPNPFNPSTTIIFSIPEETNVLIKIFDACGNEIKTLIDKKLQAGEHKVIFDAAELPSGVYLYTLKTENYSETKKMILLR